MTDNAFAHPRLAALYDLAERKREDLGHYERIVSELGATSVLDLGCGTGTLACRLAAEGVAVIGVDPAPASLALAQVKDSSENVRWIEGDATVSIGATVELALMTGNVAQVFLTDEAWHETLQALHGHLADGGHLVFEVRDPAREGWLEWTREQSYRQMKTEADGLVTSWVDLLEVALPFVTFQFTYEFDNDGTTLTSQSTLRFRDRAEIEAQLAASGFEVVEVRDAPDRPGKEFVFIARRV